MSKLNIKFNNKDYQIKESAFASSKAELETHLSSTMNGSGSVIKLGDTTYNVDSTKLATATNDLTSHLGTIAGSGTKVKVNGVEYNIDSNKVSGALSDLETTLGNLLAGGGSTPIINVGGLYQAGAIDLYKEQGAEAISDMLITSWDDLLANGTVHVDNGVVYTNADYDEWVNDSSDVLVGDLILPNDGSITALGDAYYDDDGNTYGHSAFILCDKLTGVVIPDSVTSIGLGAFDGCSSLTSITIPEGVTSIGESAFYNCSSLTSITIPDSVTSIGMSAFSDCSSLKSIVISNSVTSIEGYAFGYCGSLESITIPNSVTSIGYSAFEGCSSLTSITIPDSVTSIGMSAFSGCNSLEYNQHSNALYLGNDANPYVVLVKATGQDINTCSIWANTKIILHHAFSYCSSLTSIVIPDGVTSIGEFAFEQCSSLESIVVDSNNKYYDSRNNCNAIIETSTNTLIVGCKNTTIPNSVTSIGEHAFQFCGSLTSITIPDGVTSIGDDAFGQCSSLTNISIPDSITSIRIAAFHDCNSLEYNQHSNALYLGNDANPYVVLVKATGQGINTCSIWANTKIILNNAFKYCTLLKSITIPDGVTSIGDSAFSGCNKLTSVAIPDSVTSISRYTFHNCTSLESITIPDSVTSIEYSAFEGCSSLTSITIPDSVTSIENYAFRKCSSLTNIQYYGTKSQWKEIAFESSWNDNTGNYTITCTDGTIAKDGTETT